jgi:hypothetical protein
MDLFKANKPTIAFLPLDLDYKLPDEEELIKYCHEVHVKTDNAPAWLITPICGRFDPADWFDDKKFSTHWFHRYVEYGLPVQYVNDVDKKFPEIKYMLEQLPYKELTAATLFLQATNVKCHLDWFEHDVYEDETEKAIENEPRRFNIQLSNHHYKSSYVAASEKGKRHYSTITKECPGYCMAECYNWHGAEYAGPDKITLFTTGIIDREKRDELIERSLKKYSKEAIAFSNGELVDPQLTSKKNPFGK